MSLPESIPIHADLSVQGASLSDSLWSSLAQGGLPGKWLYHSPAQARRWLAYHQAWSPSRTQPELLAIYQAAFQALAAQAPPREGAVQVVSLGCGGGQKDALLLETLSQGEADRSPGLTGVQYIPLDISPELVREAAGQARERLPGLRLFPITADLEAEPALFPVFPGGRESTDTRIFTCLGLLPNFSHVALPAYLARLLRPGDLALVSANLSPGAGWPDDGAVILPQYDNPPARAWYAGALEELGLVPGQFEIRVGGEPLRPDGQAWQVVATAHLPGGGVISHAGRELPWPANRPLRVFFSNRFTAPAAVDVLTQGGLEVVEQWVDETGEEGIFLCRTQSQKEQS